MFRIVVQSAGSIIASVDSFFTWLIWCLLVAASAQASVCLGLGEPTTQIRSYEGSVFNAGVCWAYGLFNVWLFTVRRFLAPKNTLELFACRCFSGGWPHCSTLNGSFFRNAGAWLKLQTPWKSGWGDKLSGAILYLYSRTFYWPCEPKNVVAFDRRFDSFGVIKPGFLFIRVPPAAVRGFWTTAFRLA
jgi:hypothetical protein